MKFDVNVWILFTQKVLFLLLKKHGQKRYSSLWKTIKSVEKKINVFVVAADFKLL